ncbi:MAG: PepSY-associated TM helix domain-containing protein [Phycisphaeraceae bacterium]
MSRQTRKWIRRVHLTLAITLGLFVSILGLSGSVLVFGDEIDSWLRPELRRVSAEPGMEWVRLDDVVAAVREAVPEAEPLYLNLPSDEGTAHTFWLMKPNSEMIKAYANPYTGEVLGNTHEHAGLIGFMHDLHIHLLLGHDGVTVVGVLGLGLLVMLGTGLFLWWPGWRQLRMALTVKWKGAWRRRIYDLHRAGGAWTMPPLAFVAVTGASLAFYTLVAPALVSAFGGKLPTDTLPLDEPADGQMNWQGVLDAAEAEFPQAEPRWFYFPPEDGRSATVQVRQPGNKNPHGDTFVYVHPGRAETISRHDWSEAEVGENLVDLLYPLHIGHFGPTLLIRCIMVVLGVVPVLLFGTGIWLWWQRTKAATAAAARVQPQPAALS